MISKAKKEWPTNPVTDPKQYIIIPDRSNLVMPNRSESFPYTAVPMEKVNIKAVFTQFVLAGGLLKSFAISGNETFKTIRSEERRVGKEGRSGREAQGESGEGDSRDEDSVKQKNTQAIR